MSACHRIWSREQTRLVILVHAPGAAARLWETNARQPTLDRFWENRPPWKHQHPSSGFRQASLYNGGDSVWQYEAHHERCPPPTLRDTHWYRREGLCPAQAPRPDCGLMCRPEWRTQCRTPTTSLGVVPISCSARADVSLCALSVVLAGQCTVPFSDQVWASWRWMRLNLLTSALYHMQGPDSKRFLNLIHAYINVLLFHNFKLILILELW